MSIATTNTASIAVTPARITLDHYEHMVQCGAFEHPFDLRVELLNGEIVQVFAEGPLHADDNRFLNRWSAEVTAGHPILVSVQSPIRLPSSDSNPEPDVCWVRDRRYLNQHPGPEDVLLLIEVAETSLPKDRGPKLAAYAQAGIIEYWIVNLIDKQLEIYRNPTASSYSDTQVIRGGSTAAPLALPSATLEVAQLFPETP